MVLPGEAHGQRSLARYSPWGCKESNTTEATEHTPPSCDLGVGGTAFCAGFVNVIFRNAQPAKFPAIN